MKTIRALAAAAALVGVLSAPGEAQVPVLLPQCFDRPATIVGTDGDDVLTGTSGDDVIVALEGDDVVDGLGGEDAICGGTGADELQGGPGPDGIAVGRGADTAEGGRARDLVVEFTSDSCGPCNPVDTASRDVSADRISGGPGDDFLGAEGGNDVIDGGAGGDMAVHISRFTAVSVDLGLGRAISTAGGIDALVGIEHVIGSVATDRIRGNERRNYLMGVNFTGYDLLAGEDGPDVLFAELMGAALFGGNDEAPDLVQVALLEPAMVDLAAGVAASREASHLHLPDSITGFEDVAGNSYDDILLGDDGTNRIEGLFGHDEISGRGGNDYLFGDYPGEQPLAFHGLAPGNDFLDGGEGGDHLNGGPLVDECVNGERMVDCEQTDGPSAKPVYGKSVYGLPWWWASYDVDYLHETPAIGELLALLR